jgi:hypothetical protein
MILEEQSINIGFDQPLNESSALEDDKFGRGGFAKAAVLALNNVTATSGFTLTIEGAWGSGKTSMLSMIQAWLKKQSPAPIIVHFNPWLIGDREALLRQFFSKLSAAVELADHAANGKKVAEAIKAYSKTFDVVKLIPGAEPWASIVQAVFKKVGLATASIADYKKRDIEGQKKNLEAALRGFPKPIIVFIDDVDRLYPLEVLEMVRIVKSVGDLPNIGYVIAWDQKYVISALDSAKVPKAEQYLDKVIQVRMPLPVLSFEYRRLLLNEALHALPNEASDAPFPDSEDRIASLYYAGLREILDLPRDYSRVFNVVRLIEPTLRGEVVLSDIIGFAALIVKAPTVHELMRIEPRWFVGTLPGDHEIAKDSEEWIKGGNDVRIEAFKSCRNPNAVKKLVHHLFPKIAIANEEVAFDVASQIDGHLADPSRFLVALQLQPGGADVSLVMAKKYLIHPKQRIEIASTLTENNCMEFLEALGDITEANGAMGIQDVEQLCLDISRLIDTEPFPTRERNLMGFFRISAESVGLRALKLIVKAAVTPEQAMSIADSLVKDPKSLSIATELYARSFLLSKQGEDNLYCTPAVQEELNSTFVANVISAAEDGALFSICTLGQLLRRMADISAETCPRIYAVAKRTDTWLDKFLEPILTQGFDSVNGRYFANPSQSEYLKAYAALPELQQQAKERLSDTNLSFPARAVWIAIAENRESYAKDGTPTSRSRSS